MSKSSIGKRGEKRVITTLKKLKEKHVLLNDVTLMNKKSEMTHQLDHILIHPHGVFIIETKNYKGKILINHKNGQWVKWDGIKKTFMPNPLLQNKSHAINLYKILKGKYKVIPVVVFVGNNAPYLPDDNVINIDDLLLFIDSYPYETLLTSEDMKTIKQIIKDESIDISNKEHVANIKLLKEFKKEQQEDIRYAIENNKCPWCGSSIISKNNIYKCSHCKFEYKL